ncbi:MAG: hypothetical protein AAGD38_21965 [Acidobacteriota bacterium]
MSIDANRVLVQRPWMNFQIFAMDGWYLSGIHRKYFSNGRRNRNSGVFPLLPFGFYTARNIKLRADWSRSELALVQRAMAGERIVSLGGFALSRYDREQRRIVPTVRRDGFALEIADLHIIAWMVSVVPESPRRASK